MFEYFVLAICGILFLVVAILYLIPRARKRTTIPGPDVINELEGNMANIQTSGSLHEFLVDIHGQFGDIVAFSLGPTFCVSVVSPELFKQQAKVFDRPKALFELFEPLLNANSILYTNGSEGRKRYAAYSRSFSHDNIHNYMDTLCKMSTEFCQKWESHTKEEHIGLGEHMNAFACKAMLAVAYGQYFESDKEALQFKNCHDFVWREMENRLICDIPDSAREEKFGKCKEKMVEMLLTAYNQWKNNQQPNSDYKRFIDELLELDMSDDVAVADMMTFGVGAFQTTGTLLTWATYFLALYEEVQDKVYAEMNEVLGDETITFNAINHLKYTRQVLDETLRCSQLAPMAARVQEFDTELAGHTIPANTPVVLALGVVLHDEKLWPKAETFDPERFSEMNTDARSSYSFEPFGIGKRKCIGYRLSYSQATVLLSEILRKFKIKLVEGQIVQKQYGLVTKPQDEIWVTIEPRK